ERVAGGDVGPGVAEVDVLNVVAMGQRERLDDGAVGGGRGAGGGGLCPAGQQSLCHDIVAGREMCEAVQPTLAERVDRSVAVEIDLVGLGSADQGTGTVVEGDD